MFKHARESSGDPSGRLSMNMRVRVYPGTDSESQGVILQDFGDLAGHAVTVGRRQIAPARRWAVQLDTGNLVFVNTDDLVAD